MTAAPSAQRCRRHRRRPAVGVCVTCLSPGCGACLAMTRVGLKCQRCPGSSAGRGGTGIRARLAALLAGVVTAGVVMTLVVVFAVRGSGTGAETAPQRALPAVSTPLPVNPYGTPIPCDVQHSMC